MTELPVTDMGRGVGRPPLKVKGTQVRLPIGLPERIDAIMGPNKRAEFIRKAVVEAVEQAERSTKRAGKSVEVKPKKPD